VVAPGPIAALIARQSAIKTGNAKGIHRNSERGDKSRETINESGRII
jgi:predicted amino acid dehydrogenase